MAHPPTASTQSSSPEWIDPVELRTALADGDVRKVQELAIQLSQVPKARTGALGVAIERFPDEQASQIVHALLQAGMAPNAQMYEASNATSQRREDGQFSALSLALKNHKWAVAQKLLASGARLGGVLGSHVDVQPAMVDAMVLVGTYGPPALFEHFLRQHNNPLDALQRVGAHWQLVLRQEQDDLKAPTTRAASPEMSAQRIAILDVLYQQGVPVDAVSPLNKARTPLHIAVALKDVGLVDWLLKKGADASLRSREVVGQYKGGYFDDRATPITHLAVLHENQAVIERLLQHGLNFDDPEQTVSNSRGQTVGTAFNFARVRMAHEAIVTLETHTLRRTMTDMALPHDADHGSSLVVGRTRL